MKLSFIVNDIQYSIDVPPMKRLLDLLREDLRLTGTKEGCGEGECGACSVIINSELINSCLVPACQADGGQILTVEGLSTDGELSPLQRAFLESGAAQCGICTPGMLLAAKALLDVNPHPTRQQIREAIAGNLCRCTGYIKIIDAIVEYTSDVGTSDVRRQKQNRRRTSNVEPYRHRTLDIGRSDVEHSDVTDVGHRTSDVPTLDGRTSIRHLRKVYSPETLSEAYRILGEHRDDLKVLAGGTDIMVYLNARALTASAFLDLWKLNELRGVRDDGAYLWIGALTTYTQIINSPLVGKHARILIDSARTIGAAQIQNRGTIGGNIVNASPAGDTLPVLAVFEAEIEMGSRRGTRLVPFTRFYTGYRRTVLEPDELVLGVRLPKAATDEKLFFYKVGTRRAQAISKVVMAAKAGLDDRNIRSIQIGVGSVAPTVIRATETESYLTGKSLSPAIIDEAKRTIRQEVQPIDDVRSTEHYRRVVTGNVLEKFLRQLMEDS